MRKLKEIFETFSWEEKLDHTLFLGEVVAERNVNNYQIALYDLGQFYAEVWFLRDIPRHLYVIDDFFMLRPYLDDIDLEDEVKRRLRIPYHQ